MFGASSAVVPGVRKIAVLRANALGDYLFATPALYALRRAYPNAEIVLIGKPWHEEFLADRPGPVDRVEVVPPLPGFGGPSGPEVAVAIREDEDAAAFVARLRSEWFDLAVQVHGGGRHANPLVAAIGAAVTVGPRDYDAPGLHRNLDYVYFQPEVFRLLEVVGMVGAVPTILEPRIELTEVDRREASAVLDGVVSPPVVLHPGATDPRRRWDPARFARVGDAAAGLGHPVLITGTAAEAGVVEAVRNAMRASAKPLVSAVSLGGLAALYARCALLVGNDTGPLHLAAAVGTPTVGLYWLGNLANSAPVSRGCHRPVVSFTVNCPTCGVDVAPRGRRVGCNHSNSLLDDISTNLVLSQVKTLLAGRLQ